MNKNDEEILYEASIRYLVEKSNKRAWLITYISIIISLLMVALLFYILPLKETIPYVIKVDKSTGNTEVVYGLNKQTTTYNEAVDKHFIELYTISRESYNYELISQDYSFVQLLSSPSVSKEYIKIYTGEKARDKVLKNTFEVKAKVLSISLGESAGTKTASIRIRINKIRLLNRELIENYIKVITLSYDYFPDIKLTEEQRFKNPLGFKILNYRVDREVIDNENTL